MNSKRSYVASASLNGSLYVFGGYNGSVSNRNRLSSTEVISGDGTVSPGTPLPTPRSSHCIVTLPTGNLMILGGDPEENRKNVIIYDILTQNYTTLNSLKYERRNSACALIKNSPLHENRPIVITVGGKRQKTAEVYDYTQPNASWQESKSTWVLFLTTSFAERS